MTSTPPDLTDAEVLRANQRFYDAFSAGSLEHMSALWAKIHAVSCFHPGAAMLAGRAAVMGSWAQVLNDAAPFQLRCQEPRVIRLGEIAVVTCYEGAEDQPAHLAATNVFAREEGEWRMVHHHAGPLSSPRPQPEQRFVN